MISLFTNILFNKKFMKTEEFIVIKLDVRKWIILLSIILITYNNTVIITRFRDALFSSKTPGRDTKFKKMENSECDKESVAQLHEDIIHCQ